MTAPTATRHQDPQHDDREEVERGDQAGVRPGPDGEGSPGPHPVRSPPDDEGLHRVPRRAGGEGMTHTVSFRIELDMRVIQDAHTRDTWVDMFNLNDDRFVENDVVTWDQIFAAIALDYLAGGQHERYVIGQRTTVE
jgi:hypothetical protein